jgi:hypothetical protein
MIPYIRLRVSQVGDLHVMVEFVLLFTFRLACLPNASMPSILRHHFGKHAVGSNILH